AVPYDLLLLATGGLFLSAKLQFRGCCYALVLLGLVSLLRHTLLITDHLWSLGLEGSIGVSFFITAMAFEQETQSIQQLESQIQTRQSALANLEEEMSKAQEEALKQQIALQEKIALLQKECEELQADHSSILILNEVLRKTAARQHQEAIGFEKQLGEAQQELDWWKKTDVLEEIERLQAAKEQIQHSSAEEIERLKAAKTQIECSSAEEIERLKAAKTQIECSSAEEIERLKAAKTQIECSSAEEIERLKADKEQVQHINETLTRMHTREFFKVKDAETEIESLKSLLKASRKIEPQVVVASDAEPKYLQLRAQFEEKNRVLQQARADLFKTDTELQQLKIEKAALELKPFPKEIEEELYELNEHIGGLEEENRQLQDIVTHLSNDSPDRRKKKLKTGNPSSDQALLF
ncbi:MAG: hypothetical protein KGI83_05380, partial [Verrucomicrobiota bacterium]|nr:hypothetical protein [Verrucomicrobiota bacterium]